MKDPFSFLTFGSGDITSNGAIRGTVGSAYQLFMAIGVLGILVSLFIFAITIAGTKAQKRAEAFEEMKWKVLIAIVLFALPFFIGLAMSISAKFA